MPHPLEVERVVREIKLLPTEHAEKYLAGYLNALLGDHRSWTPAMLEVHKTFCRGCARCQG